MHGLTCCQDCRRRSRPPSTHHARDGVSARAKKGELTGPSPTDRGKPGSQLHVVSDRAGLPLAVGISAANTHDSRALASMATEPILGNCQMPFRSLVRGYTG
jgi:hypothetical protein